MWAVKINVINVAQKRARVTATRTDDITGEIWEYSCVAILDTPGQRGAVLQQIKDHYLAYLDYEGQVFIIVAGMEDTATNSLNNWEAIL